MKKAKSQGGGKSARRPAAKTVDEYVATLDGPGRAACVKLRAAIRAVAPRDAAEVISYGIPAIKTNKVLVSFAAFSDHCSLFPTAEVIAEFKRELKGLTISKGTIHFPLDRPIPTALVKSIVKARVAKEKKRR